MDPSTAQDSTPATATTVTNTPRLLWVGMTVFLIVMVVLGFGSTYGRQLVLGQEISGHAAAETDWVIHLHAAVFMGGMILLLAQTTLVACGRTRLHMTLGGYVGLALGLAVLPAASALAQAPTDGDRDFARSWKGTVHTGELQYRVFFHVQESQDGGLTARLDMPARTISGVPVAVSTDGDSITIGGRKSPHVYRGRLAATGRRIEGRMSPGPFFDGGPLTLTSLAGPVREARLDEPFAEPFRGIVLGGALQQGLFPIRSTGVSTAPIVEAADTLLTTFTPEQRDRATFPVDSDEWRHWTNSPFLERRGVSLRDMTERQRAATRGLLRATLSAKGYELSRDIMRVEAYLARLTGDQDRFGGDNVHVTVMGEPSATEPWGWQIDGHHLVVNAFVLGDQVVVTPRFFGTEPTVIDTGRYAGTKVLQKEQRQGLTFMRSLREPQRRRARADSSKSGDEIRSVPYQDNVQFDNVGLRATELDPEQRRRLLNLIRLYVDHMREGHAEVRMEQVRKHLDDTYFVWIGGVGPKSVYYYRIQSPVVLIEFDHAVRRTIPGPQGPTRDHIHIVVRTPNGGDYGKSLLRQHYDAHADSPDHQHRR